MKGWTRVPNTGGPGKLGGLWLWTQVDQLSWVACNHTLEYGSLVFPMKGEPGCPPHRWTRLTGWPVAMGTGGPAELGGL